MRTSGLVNQINYPFSFTSNWYVIGLSIAVIFPSANSTVSTSLIVKTYATSPELIDSQLNNDFVYHYPSHRILIYSIFGS